MGVVCESVGKRLREIEEVGMMTENSVGCGECLAGVSELDNVTE